MKPLKPWMDITTQIEHLKGKNIIIEDEGFAEDLLSSMNYYRLMGYALIFKKRDTDKDDYQGVKLEQISKIHKLDKCLRLTILSFLEELEIKIRFIIAYELGRFKENIHNTKENWDLERFESWHNEINFRESNELPIRHHDRDIENMPIWVVVEYLTFGQLIHLYDGIKEEYKSKINNILVETLNCQEEQITIQLHHIRNFRNKAAHFNRLYDATSDVKLRYEEKRYEIGLKNFMKNMKQKK